MNLRDIFAYGISEAEKCEHLQQAEGKLRRMVAELEERIEEKKGNLERLKTRRDDEWASSDGVLKDISSLRHEIDALKSEKTELHGELCKAQKTASALQEECGNIAKAHRIEVTQNGDVSLFNIVVRLKHRQIEHSEPEQLKDVSCSQAGVVPFPSLIPRIGVVTWAFSDARYRKGNVVVVPGEELNLDEAPVFVAGDIHGDVKSLQWVLETTLLATPKSKVVFLGDLFDRGDESDTLAALRLFVWAIHAFPGRILWLRGNHDNLVYNEEAQMFSSLASPHEFTDFLNAHSEVKDEGRFLCNLISQLPVAAMIGDVWISHGGVLQDDDQGVRTFGSFETLTEDMVNDFMWSRMVDTPSKLANRMHKGAEVGFEQAIRFAEALKSCAGIDVRHIVCGHQHLDKDGYGYVNFEKNYTKELTCQCVCSFAHENVMGESIRPAILRLQSNDLPRAIFPTYSSLKESTNNE